MLKMLIATMTIMGADDVQNDGVLCLENAGSGDTMIVMLAEKYRSARRRLRPLEIEPGKKKCIRYERLRSVGINAFYRTELENRGEDVRPIDPWRQRICDKLLKNDAVFFRLGADDGKDVSCDADTTRTDAEIRSLVAGAKAMSL